jgi:hypothetical protein
VIDLIVETQPWNWPETLDASACPWGAGALAVGAMLVAIGVMVTEIPLMLRDYDDDPE